MRPANIRPLSEPPSVSQPGRSAPNRKNQPDQIAPPRLWCHLNFNRSSKFAGALLIRQI